MLKIAMVTTTETWGRPSETTTWGYIDPAEVAALIPLRSREICGEYKFVTEVVLKSGVKYQVVGTPIEVNDELYTNAWIS